MHFSIQIFSRMQKIIVQLQGHVQIKCKLEIEVRNSFVALLSTSCE